MFLAIDMTSAPIHEKNNSRKNSMIDDIELCRVLHERYRVRKVDDADESDIRKDFTQSCSHGQHRTNKAEMQSQ